VRELKTNPQSIAYGIPSFQKGQVFDSEWPLHITLVPRFHDARPRRLLRELDGLAQRTRSIEVKVGEHALLGPEGNVPVELVETGKDLRTFHTNLMACVVRASGVLDDVSYVGYKYNAHISNRQDLEVDDLYIIDGFALMAETTPERYEVQEVFKLHD